MSAHAIECGKVWMYVGPGDGQGDAHVVTSAKGDDITTWGGPTERHAKAGLGGMSWRGSVNDFRKHFRKAG